MAMKSRGRSPVLTTGPTHQQHTRNPSGTGTDVASTLSVPGAPSESGSEGLSDFGTFGPSPSQVQGTPTTLPSSNTDNSSLGNSIFYDTDFYSTPDSASTQKLIQYMQVKIEKTKELIREEQTSRDDNVNEYLKLSSNADRQQQARIKQVFEKKNQKSAQNIAHYQKKLDEYQKRIQDVQEHRIKPKQSLGQGLKSVGGNIRDGVFGMSNTVMSKPKEFAHRLRHKFGSADDLNTIVKDNDSAGRGAGGSTGEHSNGRGHRSHHGSSSLPREGSGGALSGDSSSRRKTSLSSQSKRKSNFDDGRRSDRSISLAPSTDSEPQDHSRRHLDQEVQQLTVGPRNNRDFTPSQHDTEQESHPRDPEWTAVVEELRLTKEESDQLREDIADLQQSFKHEIEALNEQLREERERHDRLEEQMNDLTELHQHEIENIKSVVNDMEEKVQYQSEERLLDIKEHLQSLETKVNSMEHQQAQQLNLEGLDNTDARAVMMKLLTAVITVIHIFLFFMGIIMNLARPFLRTTPRAIATFLVTVASCFLYYRQHTLWSFLPNRFRSAVEAEVP